MSGSNGRHAPPSGRPTVTADMCATLGFETQVSNVNDEVLQDLQVDFIVDIALIESRGIESIAVFYGERILGGIGREGYALKECLRKGFEYVGIVREIEHGVVKIFVQMNDA